MSSIPFASRIPFSFAESHLYPTYLFLAHKIEDLNNFSNFNSIGWGKSDVISLAISLPISKACSMLLPFKWTKILSVSP